MQFIYMLVFLVKCRQASRLCWCASFGINTGSTSEEKMSVPKEMEFSEHLTSGDGVTGDIGGEIFIPVDSSGEDEGTLDEPVMKTLVSSSGGV